MNVYRKKVLRSGNDTECREMPEAPAGEYKFTITAIEVMPDHIRLLADCRPLMQDRKREKERPLR